MKILIIVVFFLVISFFIAESQSEMACYSCKHDGKYLCLNETYYLHMETCPGIPQQYQNYSGIKEVCYKTFVKQRRKPRLLITKGCAVKADNFDPCNDLKKVSVVGPKAKCFLCETSMCNTASKIFLWHVNFIVWIFILSSLNFS